jgi:putative PIG3 family NAD(P)H quinone oxidoreductase
VRAAVITAPGDSGVLRIQDLPVPEPGPGELRVRVHASALNRADLLQRRGRYAVPAGATALIPGLEYAGEVDALGPGVTGFSAGERVFGIVSGGAHAEFVLVPAPTAVRIPDALSWIDAAAVPEAFMTAYDALCTQAGLAAGERVLLLAVTSGVGIAAARIAGAMGAHAFGTTRTAAKLDRAAALGLAGCAVVEDASQLAAAVREWSSDGVDVVLDLVGGAWTGAGIDVLAPHGRLMLVGLMAGARAEIDLRGVLSRFLRITGTLLRPRSVAEKALVARAFERDVLPLLSSGAITPEVDDVLPLERIAEAHERMERNATFGKLVLAM